eukprot:COSAG01_NODE_12452_length_1736_cov_1.462431_2_plen_26_part_01
MRRPGPKAYDGMTIAANKAQGRAWRP